MLTERQSGLSVVGSYVFLHEADVAETLGIFPAARLDAQLVAHADHEFGNDTNTAHTLEAVLYGLVERVGSRLRRRRRAARRIAIVLDYSDGMRRARQVAARPATANDLALLAKAIPSS